MLNTPAWSSANVITGFRMFQPVEDGEPRFRTEAKATYDAANLYVFVRAYDPHPDSIIGLLSRRDVKTQSDQIKIMIDSYHDRRTGYEFGHDVRHRRLRIGRVHPRFGSGRLEYGRRRFRLLDLGSLGTVPAETDRSLGNRRRVESRGRSLGLGDRVGVVDLGLGALTHHVGEFHVTFANACS